MKETVSSGEEGTRRLGKGAGRGVGRGAAGPQRQRLPDGVRPAAQAAQERTAGAELAHQDAQKQPHWLLSPFSRAPAQVVIHYTF